MMLTTDLALKADPIYGPIAKRFHENPDQLAEAFAKAWYKLLHRDMGPRRATSVPWVPEPQLWQDPVPEVDHELIGAADITGLKGKILASGLSISRLVYTAWASAASFRGTDKRGGANGGRIRLAPQKDWEVNEPTELAKVLQTLERIQQDFNRSQTGGRSSRSLIWSCWAGALPSSKRRRTPATRSRSRSRRGAPTPRRNRPTCRRLPCSSRPSTGSGTISGAARRCRRRPCCWSGLHVDADGHTRDHSKMNMFM